MPLLDRIQDGLARFVPSNKPGLSASMSSGIGSGRGMMPFDDDMIVSKPAIIFHASQIFFNFLAMACFASVASFQAHWGVGPSGLSGFTVFITVAGIFLSLFMLLVPVIYEKYDKFARLARVLKEVRVGFILTGTGTFVSLMIAFTVTISAWTQPGCKNPDKDPNASKGDEFKKGLSGWCSTKKAGAIFLWLAFGFWAASFGLLFLDWRRGNLKPTGSTRKKGPRDPPFKHPPTIHEDDDLDDAGDEESTYQVPSPTIPNQGYGDATSPFSDQNHYRDSTPLGNGGGIAASRPSMDAYGAFSDPAPTGFGASRQSPPPPPPPTGFGAISPVGAAPSSTPGVSRTMQYADPYAAVRASVANSPSGGQSVPPSYESYQGYR